MLSREAEPGSPEAIREVHQRRATGLDAHRRKGLTEKAWLDRFLSGMPPEGSVLSLGCGSAEPMERYLIRAGRKLTGVDFSEAMLDMARARFADEVWIGADMRDLDPGQRFAGVMAWNSFYHLTRGDQRAMFAVFARHMLPDGMLLFTSGPEDGEVTGSVEGEPVYHSSLGVVQYACLLEEHTMRVRWFVAEDPDCGRHTVWLARRDPE